MYLSVPNEFSIQQREKGTKKLIGIIGSGNIGTDPFHPKSWSGSSKFFFETCDRFGILAHAIGVEAPLYFRIPLMIKNFSFNRRLWREKYYHDNLYYKTLTREISNKLSHMKVEGDIIQIGGIYNIPSIVKGKRKCYSYHDGNFAQALKSPYFQGLLPISLSKRAYAYEQNVYNGMDLIFTMSDYLRNSFIEDFNIPSNKVITIGSGINFKSIPMIKNKNYENKNILFIGVDFERKGGNILLEAFRLVLKCFPNAELHVVGPKTLNIPMDLIHHIRFHGYISKNIPYHNLLLQQILLDSSIFVMPSLYEPFGIAPIEANAL